MMVNAVKDQGNKDWHEAWQNLDQLENFHNQWNAPDKRIEDIWKSYRLLPLEAAYLMASHYQYEKWGWSLKPKWDLYVHFDKALCSNKNPGKISNSIASAVKIQLKIVILLEALATLKNKSNTLQDHVHVYKKLKECHPQIYQEIMHKIAIMKVEPTCCCKEFESNLEYKEAAIEKMISLYKDGYCELEDYFFKGLINKKN